MFIPQVLMDCMGLAMLDESEKQKGSLLSLLPIRSMVVVRVIQEEDIHLHDFTAYVDELGRVELSEELRSIMGWEEKGDVSVFYVDDGMFVLQRYVLPK